MATGRLTWRDPLLAVLLLAALALLVRQLGGGSGVAEADWQPALGERLLRADGSSVATDRALGEVPLVAFYFSAGWCGPCRAFSPELVGFYRGHGGGRTFEVVLVGADEDRAAMLDYMRSERMPWPAVPREDRASLARLQELFDVRGIPALIVCRRDGSVVVDSRAAGGPRAALAALGRLLPPSEEAGKAAGGP